MNAIAATADIYPNVRLGDGNVIGVQFHPEKSHQLGMRLLKNFAEASLC